MNIFEVFFNAISRLFKGDFVKDSGMRTDKSGRIYIDQNVFFKREDVKKELEYYKELDGNAL